MIILNLFILGLIAYGAFRVSADLARRAAEKAERDSKAYEAEMKIWDRDLPAFGIDNEGNVLGYKDGQFMRVRLGLDPPMDPHEDMRILFTEPFANTMIRRWEKFRDDQKARQLAHIDGKLQGNQ